MRVAGFVLLIANAFCCGANTIIFAASGSGIDAGLAAFNGLTACLLASALLSD